MTDGPSLDGLRMNVVRTAPNGVVGAETIFEFSQGGGHVFATYAGGKIVRGYLVGVLAGSRLDFRYAQLQRGGALDGGSSRCEVERLEDGRVRLTEHFEWESREGGGTNVFEELSPRSR